MSKKIFCLAIAMMLSLNVSFAQAQRGGKEGSKQGNKNSGNGKAPGGNWSESRQQSPAGHNPAGHNQAGHAGAGNENQNQAANKEKAAAGAAANNRNEQKSSGAIGAAANRNEPRGSGAAGAAAGAAAANRREPLAAGLGAGAGYAAVRNSFDRPDLYGPAWYGSNPNIWRGANWAAGSEWAATPWADLALLAGYGNNAPLSFDYGNNVTCVEGNIIQDGKEIGTAEAFSQQAFDLAQIGAEAKASADKKWLPLGVFAMVQNEQQHPHLVLQLAMDDAGNLRGNYTDTVTDSTQPILGAVDPKTQRAAWTVGTNSNAVLEAGLSNLTEGHAPALFHKNGKTDPWILVRLPQPQ